MSLDVQSKTITFTMDGLKLIKTDFTGMNCVVIPFLLPASLKDAQEYYKNAAAVGTAVQIHPKNGREQRLNSAQKVI